MVTARIDLQGLSKELDLFKRGFDAWAQQTVSSAESEKDKHFRHLRELQTAIRTLQQQQHDLEKKALEVERRLQDEKEQIGGLEVELAKIQAEQNALPALVSEVQAALDAEAKAADAAASDLATREASQHKTVSGVRNALDMYEQRLGLSFIHNAAAGQLEVVFTQIDPAQPQQQYSIAIRLLADDRYEVSSSSPELPALQDLVDDLNANNNFSAFIKAVRAAFKATILA